VKYFSLALMSLFVINSCSAQQKENEEKVKADAVTEFILKNTENDSPSISKGTVSNGSLENGKLMPFSGNNFHYFDSSSYLASRAFVNDKVRTATLATYVRMEKLAPERQFCIMECSHEHGGKLSPHRTHQNGLSIDFMVPLLKNEIPYYEMDNLGAQHYLLDFNNEGQYTKDKSISIDFNTLALHILILAEEAKKVGLEIDKVILKMELKDDLYATENGKKLLKSGVYITKSLTPIINSLHDDHYHIDFEIR
jgi:penicillin-insensitive murein endopeptidase